MEIEQEKENQKNSFCQEYFKETWENLLVDEKKFYPKINSNYMTIQNELRPKMRELLVDWIIEVHTQYRFKKKTLFHCIFIIDLYLSKNIVERKNLQLLGIAALLIASKETEIFFPKLQNLSDISDHSYTKKEINEMEIKVMQDFNFDILSPTAEEFYELIAESRKFTEKQRNFGEYFLVASLSDYSLLKYRPSIIAVSCYYIVNKFFDLNEVNSLLNQSFLGANPEEVKVCVSDLCNCVKNLSNSNLEATKKKYPEIAEMCKGDDWIIKINSI